MEARHSEMLVSCHITTLCHDSEDHDTNLQITPVFIFISLRLFRLLIFSASSLSLYSFPLSPLSLSLSHFSSFSSVLFVSITFLNSVAFLVFSFCFPWLLLSLYFIFFGVTVVVFFAFSLFLVWYQKLGNITQIMQQLNKTDLHNINSNV